ncbi:uncharacterized protein LOC131663033 [Phymastichus coffea]|uniref:uncharacterized protein LOC131663033 n=1 Tax=Phymastichus coffea TaxID=108790 RepID=UPI00273CD3B4|nr:uncharacterized protein LOC131663033 [Phymastichus coffea]
MVEQSFQASSITAENMKFSYVVGSLSLQAAQEVKDIILSPPVENPYTTLKTKLIERLCKSQEEKTIQLLENEVMGDRKLSAFFRHLRDLAGDAVNDPFVRTLWLRRLPTHIHGILASQSEATLDQLSILADKVYESAKQAQVQAQVSELNSSTLEGLLSLKLSQMSLIFQDEIRALRLEVYSLRASNGHNNPQNGRSRSRSHSRSRAHTPKPSDMCWYHHTFGSKAKKCSGNCKMHPNFKAE